MRQGPAADPQSAEAMALASRGALLSLLATAIFAILLFLAVPLLATRLFPDSPALTISLNLNEAFLLLLSLLGLSLIVQALPGIATTTAELFSKASWDETRSAEYIWSRKRDELVSAVVTVIAGTVILAARHRLTRFLGARSGSATDTDNAA